MNLCVRVFFLFAFSLRTVCGWSSQGHQAIAMVAVSGLNSHVNAVLRRMMGKEDIIDTADWAHQVENSFPDSSKLHYMLASRVNQQCGKTVVVNEDNCPDDVCIVRGLQFFYKKLKGEDPPQLKCFENINLTDLDAVRFLVNLIADLHQPLRLGFKEDNGGKDINLNYETAEERKGITNLFDFWEAQFMKKIELQKPFFWNSGWTHVNSLPPELFHTLEQEWTLASEEERVNLFEKWANETFSVACRRVYINPLTQKSFQSGEQLIPIHESAFFSVLRSQILLGGARTAIVLNSILNKRDISKLRRSSGFPTKVSTTVNAPERFTFLAPQLSAVWINMMIAFIVLAIILYTVKVYSGCRSSKISSPRAIGKPLAAKHVEKHA